MTARRIRIGDLAAKLGRAVEGDADAWITGVAALEDAGPGDLSFVRSPKFAKLLAASRAEAVIVPIGLDTGGRCAIRSPRPGLDFARAVRQLEPERAPSAGVHPQASVAAGAQIDARASVGPFCVVSDGAVVGPRTVLHSHVVLGDSVRLGADCVVHDGCFLGAGTALGDRVILHPGVVLGGDGFGYVPDEAGHAEKVPHVGSVVVGHDVEIGANTTVDRGSLAATTIGNRTKIDNLVHIAHGCRIGDDVTILAQCGLAGGTIVERGAILMGQVGVSGHLTIGERAYVGPQGGVTRDVPAGIQVWGTPFHELRVVQKFWAVLPRLPDLLRRVRALERRLNSRDDSGS